MFEWLKRLLAKIFGPETAAQKATPQDEARRKMAEIEEAIGDHQSKGRVVDQDRENLRQEIRQRDKRADEYMDEYEALPEGLEKTLVLGKLEAYESVTEEMRARVEDLNRSWSINEREIQILKHAKERIQAALTGKKSPEELARLLYEIGAEAKAADQDHGTIIAAGSELGGGEPSFAEKANRDKMLARLAARRVGKNSAAPTPQAAPAPQAAPTAPAVQPTPPSPVSPSTPAAADQRADQEGRPC